jgi:hypothetical protein
MPAQKSGLSRSRRRIMGYSFTAAVCGLVAAALCAASPAYSQAGFDRFGGDYANSDVRSGDPAICAGRCDRDARCRAWSFSYPGPGGGAATCWLKSRVTPRTPNPCCVSVVRGAGVIEPRTDQTTEWGIDRDGGDLRILDLPADPTGASCKTACEGEGRCRAWTYARPGYEGRSARCFLKERLTAPRRRPCCISGVVR